VFVLFLACCLVEGIFSIIYMKAYHFLDGEEDVVYFVNLIHIFGVK